MLYECSQNAIRFDVRASKNSNKMQLEYLEVYKIIHDMYGRSVALELPRNVSSTRGNKYKLQKHNFHYNFRKFSFAARVVKQFETRLDKFWSNQDVMFDWIAEITGIGDRSEFKLETVLESIVKYDSVCI